MYHVNLKYIRNLSHVDDNVMLISPQIGKENRLFVGVILLLNSMIYKKERMFAGLWTTMLMCAILKNNFVPFRSCCDTCGCGVRKTQKGYAHSSRGSFG